MIKFTNLTKAFGDHTALKDISVQIYEGQTTVIVGSSGSGKSTLLRCINLLEIPQKRRAGARQAEAKFRE
ncbi:ATP-binding cassette domain-containing protein [Campylobacter showae]|jgi:glutamine ABC transporter, ATP-binding protein GlnQ|uniref:ATP-binding cassette domain-containing protein n=1 Tax=Campylobacter showae TaxID=204 RepID=UPI0024047F46|nr:ATP-binding cassette domain-containing protein [Campylobacter showae]